MSRIIKLYEKFLTNREELKKINEEWMPSVPYFFPSKYSGESMLPTSGYIFEVRKYRNGATGLFCISGNYKKEPVHELLFILDIENFEMSEDKFHMDDIDTVTTREGMDRYLIFTHVDELAAPEFKKIGFIPENAESDFNAEYGKKMYKLNRPFRIKVI